jgi:diguanylate cyclase (GGDEF)-like protein
VVFAIHAKRRRLSLRVKSVLLATHDKLTGLPALRLVTDRAESAVSHARRVGEKVALMFVDLDGFKAVNDGHGHEAGDHVLAQVAARLKACVRASDTVARIGGDEFLVLLVGLRDAAAAEQIADEIVAAVSQPIPFAATTLTVGASVGIALFPDHAVDTSSLRRVADQAMYRVKRAGKNAHAFAEPVQRAA